MEILLFGLILFVLMGAGIYFLTRKATKYDMLKGRDKNLKEYFKREKKILQKHNKVITDVRGYLYGRMHEVRNNK
jgi:hypothetical protein